MSSHRFAATAGLYALFAGLATAANLGVQRAVWGVWPWAHPNLAAMVAGTGVGLLLKYVLDKQWIFHLRTVDLRDDARRVVLYAATGAGTTAVFWGAELAFLGFFGTQAAKYLGAALGLGIGYTMKYFLDARFVFSRRPRRVSVNRALRPFYRRW